MFIKRVNEQKVTRVSVITLANFGLIKFFGLTYGMNNAIKRIKRKESAEAHSFCSVHFSDNLSDREKGSLFG